MWCYFKEHVTQWEGGGGGGGHEGDRKYRDRWRRWGWRSLTRPPVVQINQSVLKSRCAAESRFTAARLVFNRQQIWVTFNVWAVERWWTHQSCTQTAIISHQPCCFLSQPHLLYLFIVFFCCCHNQLSPRPKIYIFIYVLIVFNTNKPMY